MKFEFNIKEIDKLTALDMIKKYHYSNSLPRLNKVYLGFYLDDELVGAVTLGWGTRPLHTIKKLFPSLYTKDYFEIGRMCMNDDMPRNSESQMLKALVKWIKINYPEKKILFTWADGLYKKVGYVYQASNFLYASYSEGELYSKGDEKIHPRSFKKILEIKNDSRITVRPTMDQMKKLDIKHYKGKQFRYVFFLCNKSERKKLMNESLVDLNRNYPKEKDLELRQHIGKRKWIITNEVDYLV